VGGGARDEVFTSLAFWKKLKKASMPEAVLAVYEAKNAAEAVEGILQETDLVAIRMDKPAHPFTAEQLATLDTLVGKRPRQKPSAEDCAVVSAMIPD
jgi:hypothetical protein